MNISAGVECINHISEVSPKFHELKNLYPIKLGKDDIGCILESINDDEIHFGIYTMFNIRGKRLHIVEKYLNLYGYPAIYILHTTEDCGVADF